MYSKPQFMQGLFPFEGQGLNTPGLLSSTLTYQVPVGKRAQFIYFRAGNSSSDLIHVPLAVVEDLTSGTEIAVHVGAPSGISGTLILDIGFVEI